MPIYGLTDRGLAFPEIGRIRKGAAKDPNKNQPGADLTYFRVVFDASEVDAQQSFSQTYASEPRLINIVFPFNDFDSQASFWLEAYNSGRMVARSDGQVYLMKSITRAARCLLKMASGYHRAHLLNTILRCLNILTPIPEKRTDNNILRQSTAKRLPASG